MVLLLRLSVFCRREGCRLIRLPIRIGRLWEDLRLYENRCVNALVIQNKVQRIDFVCRDCLVVTPAHHLVIHTGIIAEAMAYDTNLLANMLSHNLYRTTVLFVLHASAPLLRPFLMPPTMVLVKACHF